MPEITVLSNAVSRSFLLKRLHPCLWLVLFILNLNSINAYAAAEFDIHLRYRITDAMSPPQPSDEPWLEPDQNTVSLGFTDQSVWMEATISSLEAQAVEGILEIGNPLLDEIGVFEKKDGVWIKLHQLGDRLVFATRPVEHRHFLIPLHFSIKETKTIGLLVRNRDAMIIPVEVHARQTFFIKDQTTLNFFTAIYGMLVALAVYAFTIFLLTRDRTYLYYSLFLFSVIFFNGVQHGTLFHWIWPQQPQWQNIADPVALILLLTTALHFTFSFLGLPDSLPKAKPFMQGAKVTCIINMSLCFILPYETLILVAILSLVPLTAIGLFFAIVLSLRGHSNARYYLLGWSMVFVGGMFNAAIQIKLLPYHFLGQNGLMIGNAIESLIFSFALARKFNLAHVQEKAALRAAHESDQQKQLALQAHQESLLRENQLQQDKVILAQQTSEAQKQLIQEREAHISELDRKVMERTHQVRFLLENLSQGIFTVTASDCLVMDPDISPFLESILEVPIPASREPIEYIFQNSNLNSEQRDMVRQALLAIIGEDEAAFAFNKDHLPFEIEISLKDQRTKRIEIDWNPIIINHKCERMLVCLRDVTALKQTQRQALEQKQARAILEEVLHSDITRLDSFLSSCSRFFRHAGEAELIQSLGMFHTKKGEARALGLRVISLAIHEAEECLQKGRRDEHQDIILKLNNLLGQYLEARKKLQGNLLRSELPAATILEIFQYLHNSGSEQALKLLRALSPSCQGTLAYIIQPLRRDLELAARDLRKPIANLVINSPELMIPKSLEEVIAQVLGHILINAMDHGIENEEERLVQGKPGHGRIEVLASLTGSALNLRIADDGRGLDLVTIRNKAFENGLAAKDAPMPNQKLARLVFHPKFSTKDQVSLYSGRGFGLSAVAATIEAWGGTIEISLMHDKFAKQVPFVLDIALPIPGEARMIS